jgi:signal transduction histidine kinase
MKRLPIRARLTIVFAIATTVVLALTGAFVYLRVQADLNSSLNETLRTRADDLTRSIGSSAPGRITLGGAQAEGNEDTLTQILGADGAVIDSSEAAGTAPALDVSQLDAIEKPTFLDSEEVDGIEGQARVLAQPVERDGERLVVVVGASTSDRVETLSGLVKTFAIAAPLALLLASGLGYGLATLAMRPVEAMRRRATRITLDHSGERLPLPESSDEINRLGRTLNEMLERIEGSLERERGFVADASHELRTPLAILRSELELGMRQDRSREDRLAAMESASEEVERLQRLTDDLLALSRSEEGELPIESRRVELEPLLQRVRTRFVARAEADDRTIEVAADSAALATLDPHLIESALSNLVDNALRHGSGAIALCADVGVGFVTFAVSDQGDGFPPAFTVHAFERFSRAEHGRTTQGNGLGLAIVKAVAEAHGGDVSIVESDWGATIQLRIADRPEAAV